MSCQVFYSQPPDIFEKSRKCFLWVEPAIESHPKGYSTIGKRSMRRKSFQIVQGPRRNEHLTRLERGPAFYSGVKAVAIDCAKPRRSSRGDRCFRCTDVRQPKSLQGSR